MRKKRILGCLRVSLGVRVPPVEYHCSTAFVAHAENIGQLLEDKHPPECYHSM
jgi:hypothetical protein